MSYKTSMSGQTPRRTSMPASTFGQRKTSDVSSPSSTTKATSSSQTSAEALPAASSQTTVQNSSSGLATGGASSSSSSSPPSSSESHSLETQYMMYSPLVMTPISQLPTGPRRQSRPVLPDHPLSRNPEDYNPDGSLRTMHRLPRFDDMYAQAEKTRYVRPREPFSWEKSLSIKEIFDKK